MKLYYGFEGGKFVLAVTDEEPNPTVLQRISMSRAQTQKISKHMQFGREGETRVLAGHEQLILPARLQGRFTLEEVKEVEETERARRAPNGDPDTIVPAPAKHKRRP